ncbi:RNA-binding protein [Thiomicrospira sp. XS5]|jgi:ribosome-associated heat shock protein Hsp15|uniref:Heat shock protein 15 n=1 Tax=Hydrogenovibrio thermophilus TaxID=265883 RepID=A0A451G423_9GAMM|nr:MULTISPECIES: RNA-binding S4 domain-containing protein [Piscirickettsiaceae]AZR80903.1 RNA-binding protein [Thiomicrospira sp. S5]KUJ74164.1 RNA-binding protein [Thiomicrospira sp. XS5]QAB14205.1 RNA-binding S4 domain-containing protein [Hydrogenovibrio thermophilus]
MEKVRVDKWLWAARFFKTRGVALDAVKGGKIELNGSKPKPSKTVSEGDVLKITQPHRKVEVTVLQVSDKRGSAQVAETLYRIDHEMLNQKTPPPQMALAGYRERGKGRPTKRDRRKIEQMTFGE